jgi:hypothetical protein
MAANCLATAGDIAESGVLDADAAFAVASFA